MEKYLTIFILSLFIFHARTNGFAQFNRQTDSLFEIINAAHTDTLIASGYNSLSELWIGTNEDSAIKFSNKAIEVINHGLLKKNETDKNKLFSLKAQAFNNMGTINFYSGQLHEAINCFFKSVEFSKQCNDNKNLGIAYNNIGATYEQKGDLLSASEFYEKSLQIHKNAGNKKESTEPLNNLGHLYEEQGDIVKSIFYYEQALKIDEELNNIKAQTVVLHNLASIYNIQKQRDKALVYFQKSLKISLDIGAYKEAGLTQNNIGLIYRANGDYLQSKKIFEQSIENCQKAGFKRGIALALTNLGSLFYQENNIAKALEYHQKSRDIYELIHYKKGIVYTSIDLGEIALRQKNNENAVKYGMEALTLAQEIKNPKMIKNASFFMQKVYRIAKYWEKALEMNKIYISMSDSLQNDRTKEAALKQRIKYEFDKREALKKAEYEKQVQLFRQQQTFTTYKAYFLATILLLGALIAVLLINRQRIKITKQQEAHALEQKLAHNQLEKNKLEKENLEANLKLNQEKLNRITELFREKSRLIDKMEEQLEKAQAENLEEKNVKQLLTNIEEYINPNQYWEEFITSFNLVNQTFFDTLLKNFPDLTKTETRLCALIKCNLGNKEIANILHITPDSVKKSRNRLRKKLQLEADDSLTEYILSF